MKSVVLVKGKEGEQVEEGAEDVRPADNGGNLENKNSFEFWSIFYFTKQ